MIQTQRQQYAIRHHSLRFREWSGDPERGPPWPSRRSNEQIIRGERVCQEEQEQQEQSAPAGAGVGAGSRGRSGSTSSTCNKQQAITPSTAVIAGGAAGPQSVQQIWTVLQHNGPSNLSAVVLAISASTRAAASPAAPASAVRSAITPSPLLIAGGPAGRGVRTLRDHPGGGSSRRREFCHFDDTPCLSILKHLLQVEGGAAE